MPDPRERESEDDFVSRCIPVVIQEGTAQDGSQAAAICHSMWRNRNKGEDLREPARFGSGQALGRSGIHAVGAGSLDELEQELREGISDNAVEEPLLSVNPGRTQTHSTLGTGLVRGEKLRQP